MNTYRTITRRGIRLDDRLYQSELLGRHVGERVKVERDHPGADAIGVMLPDGSFFVVDAADDEGQRNA